MLELPAQACCRAGRLLGACQSFDTKRADTPRIDVLHGVESVAVSDSLAIAQDTSGRDRASLDSGPPGFPRSCRASTQHANGRVFGYCRYISRARMFVRRARRHSHTSTDSPVDHRIAIRSMSTSALMIMIVFILKISRSVATWRTGVR